MQDFEIIFQDLYIHRLCRWTFWQPWHMGPNNVCSLQIKVAQRYFYSLNWSGRHTNSPRFWHDIKEKHYFTVQFLYLLIAHFNPQLKYVSFKAHYCLLIYLCTVAYTSLQFYIPTTHYAEPNKISNSSNNVNKNKLTSLRTVFKIARFCLPSTVRGVKRKNRR